MKTTINENIECPNCHSHEFVKDFADDGCYVCKNYIGHEQECRKVSACFCEHCNKFYLEKNFGYHGDVYECKKCGRIQWGLTEFKRDYRDFVTSRKHYYVED